MGNDLNQRARDEFKLAQQRSAFLQALAQGQTGLYDDLGHRLEPGHLVVYAVPPNTWRWLVHSIEPDLRPNVPLGTMRAMLTTTVPLYFPAGTRLPQVLIVGEQEKPGEQLGEQQAETERSNGAPDAPERPEPAADAPPAN